MKLIIGVAFISLLTFGYYQISYSHLSSAVIQKRHVLDAVLRAKGYKPHYVLLSGYRPPWLNKLLPLAASQSVHQQGLAIDLFVMDIDGDNRFTDLDLTILSETLDQMDKKTPRQRGGVGLYHHSFPRMVHFDVSGRHHHWDY